MNSSHAADGVHVSHAPEPVPVAFLGAGQMGAGMVRALLRHGYSVTVWSRTPERLQELAALGATITADLTQAVRGASMVAGCLRDSAITRDVYLREGGVLQSARAGTILIEHGTFDPTLAETIADAAEKQECRFLDAPVSGGPERASSGELVTMVGGEPMAFERASAMMRCYSRTLVRVGGPGAGERMKLVNQLLVTVHTVAAAEAAALIAKGGIDHTLAHEVLMDGWGASAMLDRELPRALAGAFGDSGATVGKLAEVQPLIADFLGATGTPSHLFPVARRLFDSTVAAGGADLDLAAIVLRYLSPASS